LDPRPLSRAHRHLDRQWRGPIPIQPAWPGLIYQARLGDQVLVVTIRRGSCQVTPNGETYPSRVTIEVDGRMLEGCGRSV
jgi:hypothetical protein